MKFVGKASLDTGDEPHPNANDLHVPLPISKVCQNPQCAGFFSFTICFNLEKTLLSALK